MRRERNWAVTMWLLAAWLVCPGIGNTEESSGVLATVDGREITDADVADKVAPQMMRINNQIYAAKKAAVDAVINDQLIEAEAKKRGISREELMKQEVLDKAGEPTDAEIEQWYNTNKARIQNKPLAEVKPQITQTLKNNKLVLQQQAFLQGLRKSASVKMLLKPPLVKVAIDGSPARGPAKAPITFVEFSDFQ